jgi:hypothetical protein
VAKDPHSLIGTYWRKKGGGYPYRIVSWQEKKHRFLIQGEPYEPLVAIHSGMLFDLWEQVELRQRWEPVK